MVYKIRDGLKHMESTYGWQWLTEQMDRDEQELIDDICRENTADDLKRGQVKYIRDIRNKIKTAYLNAENYKKED